MRLLIIILLATSDCHAFTLSIMVPGEEQRTTHGTISTPWNFNSTREATKQLKPGDVLLYTDPDGTVSFRWQATEEFLTALTAMNSGDYATALPLMLAEAERGDARAQYNLTYLAKMGAGTYEDAYKWMVKAREQGYAFAIWRLGFAFEKGLGVKVDRDRTLALYREAAKHGIPEAEFSFGIATLNAAEPDKKLGLEWIQRAARHGNAEAAKFLNAPPETKKENKATDQQDMAANLLLLENAAAQGDARAEMTLGSIHARALGVPRDMEKAVDWYKKAADHGQTDALIILGLMYLNGDEVKQDQAAGLRYLRSAVDNKRSGPAAALLSSFYHLGQGVDKDETESRTYLKRATELCSPDELLGAGMMFLGREGARRDEDTGFQLVSFSAKKGYIPAQFVLGDYYYRHPLGPESRSNNAKAVEWHLKAATQGYAQAQWRIATLYTQGTYGVRMEPAKADHWLKLAAAQGMINAVRDLKKLKPALVKKTSQFRSVFAKSREGGGFSRSLTVRFCTEVFDVPMHSPEKLATELESAVFFTQGPNPQLDECLRRIEIAEAEANALED